MKSLIRNAIKNLKEDLANVRRANRDKEAALKKTNRDKEVAVRKAEMDKKQAKTKIDRDKEMQKRMDKKESVIQKVVEYIKSDGARKKCAGGDGRRTENHDCDKVHSGMSHDEWEASQDTPKDEAKSGGGEAYKKFFDAKLKKYGVSSPSELEGDAKKKFYDEIDAEWEGDNEED
jgi:hypothetical protein